MTGQLLWNIALHGGLVPSLGEDVELPEFFKQRLAFRPEVVILQVFVVQVDVGVVAAE